MAKPVDKNNHYSFNHLIIEPKSENRLSLM